jgi:hypothetical protein
MDLRRSKLEIAAVILTGATFLVFENVLHLKLPFLITCTLLWSIYLVRRILQDRTVLADWGLRRDTLRPAALLCLGFFAVAAGTFACYRLWKGWLPLPATALVVLALYPIWGFIQQFVVQALVTKNLDRLGVNKALIVPIAAVLFGLAHLPDWPLVGLCFVAGLAWSATFLWRPNLIPIAITHAWLGTLTYYWILERDPWGEMFGHG